MSKDNIFSRLYIYLWNLCRGGAGVEGEGAEGDGGSGGEQGATEKSVYLSMTEVP